MTEHAHKQSLVPNNASKANPYPRLWHSVGYSLSFIAAFRSATSAYFNGSRIHILLGFLFALGKGVETFQSSLRNNARYFSNPALNELKAFDADERLLLSAPFSSEPSPTPTEEEKPGLSPGDYAPDDAVLDIPQYPHIYILRLLRDLRWDHLSEAEKQTLLESVQPPPLKDDRQHQLLEDWVHIDALNLEAHEKENIRQAQDRFLQALNILRAAQQCDSFLETLIHQKNFLTDSVSKSYKSQLIQRIQSASSPEKNQELRRIQSLLESSKALYDLLLGVASKNPSLQKGSGIENRIRSDLLKAMPPTVSPERITHDDWLKLNNVNTEGQWCRGLFQIHASFCKQLEKVHDSRIAYDFLKQLIKRKNFLTKPELEAQKNAIDRAINRSDCPEKIAELQNIKNLIEATERLNQVLLDLIREDALIRGNLSVLNRVRTRILVHHFRQMKQSIRKKWPASPWVCAIGYTLTWMCHLLMAGISALSMTVFGLHFYTIFFGAVLGLWNSYVTIHRGQVQKYFPWFARFWDHPHRVYKDNSVKSWVRFLMIGALAVSTAAATNLLGYYSIIKTVPILVPWFAQHASYLRVLAGILAFSGTLSYSLELLRRYEKMFKPIPEHEHVDPQAKSVFLIAAKIISLFPSPAGTYLAAKSLGLHPLLALAFTSVVMLGQMVRSLEESIRHYLYRSEAKPSSESLKSASSPSTPDPIPVIEKREASHWTPTMTEATDTSSKQPKAVCPSQSEDKPLILKLF